MAASLVGRESDARLGGRLLARVAEQGSAAHPYLSSEALLRGPHAARNLADAVHFLCALHARHPGVVDHAAARAVDPSARQWFASAVPAFAGERGLLARLAVAAGPLPSTPGAADNQAAALGQRHALEMLAQSERNGCALGAALAVVTDWSAIRAVLDVAAARFGVQASSCALDTPHAIHAFADGQDEGPGFERALMFGAEQVLLQHFGLWDLLEARQEARGDN
jgi:hypothetical protein